MPTKESGKLLVTPFPGAYFLPQVFCFRTVEVPREGGDMGKRKKVAPLDWHRKATVCAQLLSGSACLIVAISKLIDAVSNWPIW
jgi:hypothetical protein